MTNCLSRRDQKVHLIFQKLYPRGTKAFYSNGFKVKGSIHQDGFITNNDHQFFQKSRFSKTWKHFFIFSFSFSALKLILYLKTSAKSR